MKILEVPKICLLETGKFKFKHQKELLPTQICNHFAPQEIFHSHALRSRSRNDPPRFFSQTKIGEKSLQFKKNQKWDDITLEVTNSEFFNVFSSVQFSFILINQTQYTYQSKSTQTENKDTKWFRIKSYVSNKHTTTVKHKIKTK